MKENNIKEKEILEFVEIHAIAKNMIHKSSGRKRTVINVWYPEGGKDSEHYSDGFDTPDNPEEMTKKLKASFKKITQQIIKEINSPDKDRYLIKEIVYKVCPQMICGDNPCSCSKEYLDRYE